MFDVYYDGLKLTHSASPSFILPYDLLPNSHFPSGFLIMFRFETPVYKLHALIHWSIERLPAWCLILFLPHLLLVGFPGLGPATQQSPLSHESKMRAPQLHRT